MKWATFTKISHNYHFRNYLILCFFSTLGSDDKIYEHFKLSNYLCNGILIIIMAPILILELIIKENVRIDIAQINVNFDIVCIISWYFAKDRAPFMCYVDLGIFT